MKRLIGLILFFGLSACAQPVAPLVEAAVTATAVPPPTTTSTPTETATPLPEPATPTSAPTSTATLTPSLTPTSSPTPEPTATPTPSPTPDPFACRPLAELQGTQPVRVWNGAAWGRPSASPDILGVGSGGGLNLIHLGFDVEGSPAHLGELLDVLDRHGVKTTMFILGSWAETYPGWVTELARRGHELGNHTYSHSNLKPMTAEEVLAELQRTETAVLQLTGQSTKPWLRPPFGSRSEVSVQTAFDNGWTTVTWTGSADDWREDWSEDDMCRTLRTTAFPGAILYAHTFRPEMAGAVERFILEMQSRGFTFVPLSVLMSDNPEAYYP
ncbi:MAG: polysaccharide deacetylase family protein [Anaerolineae bacterium]